MKASNSIGGWDWRIKSEVRLNNMARSASKKKLNHNKYGFEDWGYQTAIDNRASTQRVHVWKDMKTMESQLLILSLLIL